MSGEQHLGWDALERLRTDGASAAESAHLAACAPCRDALADLERLASGVKASLSAQGDAIPAACEDTILAAARERAGAIASHKLVRPRWWRQRSTMALAASLIVTGSAAYLTHLTSDQPSPRSEAARTVRDEEESDRGAVRSPVPGSAEPLVGAGRRDVPAPGEPERRNEELRVQAKKEAARPDDDARLADEQAFDSLQKAAGWSAHAQLAEPKASPAPAPAPGTGLKRSEAKGDAASSKDAELEVPDLAAAPPPSATVTAAPPAPAPAPTMPATEPARPGAAPTASLADLRARSLGENVAAPTGPAAAGAAAGAIAPSRQAEAPLAAGEDRQLAALAEPAEGHAVKLWLPPRTGLWAVGQAEQRDLTTPQPLRLVSTEIEVRVGETVTRRVRQRFSHPSGERIIATYSIGIVPGERAADLSLTIGASEVPPQPAEDLAHVRVWQDLPIAGTTIEVTTFSPPRPLEGVASGSVRIWVPVPPPPPQATDDPPKLAVRLEPAQGFRIGQPVAAGLAITGHPLGSGVWDLTLPSTLGVKEDLLELDVPIVKSGG